MSKTNWSKENLSKIVKESYSIAEVLRKLGLKVAGGNYANCQQKIDMYNIDTSHFTGQRWQKSPNFSQEDIKKVPLEKILKENTNYKSDYLKKRLIAVGYKTAACENCGISEWNGKPVPLELHHINGNHYDNKLENLQVLCLNCHAQTDTYRKRKPSVKIPKPLSNQLLVKEKVCPTCGKTFIPHKKSTIYCSRECAGSKQKQLKITLEQINQYMDECNTMIDLGNKLGVSKTTIRKYLELYGLLDMFKSKFDFRAKPVIQYDMDGNYIKEWPSINDVETTLHIKDVGKCASFKRKSCGGFIWRYKE